MEVERTGLVNESVLQALQDRLGVRLSNLHLLEIALTHRSYLGEITGIQSNERLEFLGDSVLGLVISEHLYMVLQGRPEGDLSKAKALAVSEPSLAEAARKLDLTSAMLLSTGENISGGRERASILSDMYEAIVAVIYLDLGLETAREFILRTLSDVISEVEDQGNLRDFKSRLQQVVQSKTRIAPRYVVVDEIGADHDKTFTVQVEIEGKPMGLGRGKSKKQAEQQAAEKALETMENASDA